MPALATVQALSARCLEPALLYFVRPCRLPSLANRLFSLLEALNKLTCSPYAVNVSNELRVLCGLLALLHQTPWRYCTRTRGCIKARTWSSSLVALTMILFAGRECSSSYCFHITSHAREHTSRAPYHNQRIRWAHRCQPPGCFHWYVSHQISSYKPLLRVHASLASLPLHPPSSPSSIFTPFVCPPRAPSGASGSIRDYM